jgi:hypothetical protein
VVDRVQERFSVPVGPCSIGCRGPGQGPGRGVAARRRGVKMRRCPR